LVAWVYKNAQEIKYILITFAVFLPARVSFLFSLFEELLVDRMVDLKDLLKREEELFHELIFRDKIKSAEYHYAISFDFDGFFEDEIIDRVVEKIKFLSKEVEFETFKLGCSWSKVDEDERAHLKLSIQTPLLQRIEQVLKKKVSFATSDVEFLVDFCKNLVMIRLYPVFVVGNYCKYSREIAQTEFFCNKCRGRGCWYCNNTGHFSSESVEQLIGKILAPHFEAKLMIMHGAGREDMDVLMLGRGRPFIAELLLPKKRSANLKLIEKEINSKFKGKISVNSLAMCTQKDVSPLKETHHDKIYAALVVSDKEIDFGKIKLGEVINVVQKTPTRVAKRRADLDREKKVTLIRVGAISKNALVLILKTSHGTYVKEFISGDGAKTIPSLSSILEVNCSCVLLDVLEIC